MPWSVVLVPVPLLSSLAVFWRCALWCVYAGPGRSTAARAAKQHAVVALSALSAAGQLLWTGRDEIHLTTQVTHKEKWARLRTDACC